MSPHHHYHRYPQTQTTSHPSPRLPWQLLLLTLTCLLAPMFLPAHSKGQFDWMGEGDRFDQIDARLRSVDASNCRSKSKEQLVLPKSVVSQLPVYNQLLSRTWYKNRTTLIHIHNMALNRAYFYSYILQRMNTTKTFRVQPGWMYFYLSATADVHANPNTLNASGIFFDSDCHYPNWFTTVPFNRTLPLFAPRVYRKDNWNSQSNFLREPHRRSAKGRDLGAGINRNYTRPAHKNNHWYTNWLPDLTGHMDSLVKFSYHIGIKESDRTGSFKTDTYQSFSFFGPASPGANEKDERKLPVVFTPPYFDCGQSNKWIISAVAPVVDFMPRYSTFVHLRRPRFVSTVAMDIDFVEIDFNPCGLSAGNPGPSYLSGIDKCKSDSTLCVHQEGLGFKRGSYNCECHGGKRYPWWLQPPYKGMEIEQSTEEEYKTGYSCTSSLHQNAMPLIDGLPTVEIEGGDSPLNSGGLTVRKRRTVDNRSVSLEDLQDVRTNQGESFGQAEPIKTMDFTGTLREIKREDLETLRRTDLLLDVTLTPQEVDQEYALRNDVDWEVEKMYQSDVRDHETLKESLGVIGDVRNVTRSMETLRRNVKDVQRKHVERFNAGRGDVHSRRKRSSAFDQNSFDKMMRILRQKSSVTSGNCRYQPSHRLVLPGTVAYGVEKQFETEGRTALRLAQFLSAYLQIASPDDNFGNLRGGGRLHADQIFGEVVANVMGNFKIFSAGAYFDRDRFENQDGSTRELFGPFAFKKDGGYYAYDSAGLKESYVQSDWFIRAKTRFGMNFSGLKGFSSGASIRSDVKGTANIKHEYYPLRYRAAPYERGFWTAPYFRCDGNIDAWVVQYVAPFFGLDTFKRLQFRGVTTIEVPLDLLEINQCPQPFTTPNAFKNTARCDYMSTTCSPQSGFYFRRGAYRCDCRLGFEYWSADGKEWFEGSYVEGEWERKRKGIFSRFDDLYCRPSSAPHLHTGLHLDLGLLIFVYFVTHYLLVMS